MRTQIETDLELLKVAASLIVPSTLDVTETLEKNFRKIKELVENQAVATSKAHQ